MSRFTDHARLAVAVLLAAVSLALVTDVSTGPRAEAVGPSDWQAGAIITDNLFYDNTSMSVEQVQAFLDGKVTSCAAGYTCLKSYVENPSTKVNNIGGGTVDGGWTSAQIIKYAADTSRISPRSLLVLLQKESGLVTKTAPTSTTYRTATGYGCPDTAPCDAQYYGFYNQVTQAAAAFRRYADNPTNYRYRAGTTTAIYWHPDLDRCGSQNVTIQNQATAGLYIYTPYQPNAASLAAYPGTGDSCSSYGNRNFWYLWNNWFGSTSAPPPSNGGRPIVHPDGGRCIDVPQATTSQSTQVQIYDCSGGPAQQWKLTAASELRVYGSPERCLDVRGGSFTAGTAVQIYECNGTAPQKWSVNADGTITSQGWCLDAAGAGTANGTKLIIDACNGSGAQKWAGPASANGGKALQQVASGRCLMSRARRRSRAPGRRWRTATAGRSNSGSARLARSFGSTPTSAWRCGPRRTCRVLRCSSRHVTARPGSGGPSTPTARSRCRDSASTPSAVRPPAAPASRSTPATGRHPSAGSVQRSPGEGRGSSTPTAVAASTSRP
jgi:hypothetical protein